MVVVSGLVFVASQASLPYVNLARSSPTVWDLVTRTPLITTIVAALAIVFAAAGVLGSSVTFASLAAGCSFYLFGRVFPIGLHSYTHAGVGFWLDTASTVFMSAGGILALTSWASPASGNPTP
jgi:hypothetical protein